MTQVTLQQLDQEQPEGPKALLGHFGAAQSQPGLPAAGAGGISKPAVLLGAGQELGQAAQLLPISAGMLQGHRHPNVTVCSKPKGPPPSPRARFSHLFGDKWDKRPLPLRKGTAPGLRAGREGQLGELSWGGGVPGAPALERLEAPLELLPHGVESGPKIPMGFVLHGCQLQAGLLWDQLFSQSCPASSLRSAAPGDVQGRGAVQAAPCPASHPDAVLLLHPREKHRGTRVGGRQAAGNAALTPQASAQPKGLVSQLIIANQPLIRVINDVSCHPRS